MSEAWVVMKCRRGAREHFWAWCKVVPGHPGFDDIFYTQMDGMTAHSPSGDDLPDMEQHLFTVVFPGEVAPAATRFQVEYGDTQPAPAPIPDSWAAGASGVAQESETAAGG